jgi:hypothetical protein
MKKGSKSLDAIIPLIMEEVTVMTRGLEKEMEMNPVLRQMAVTFVQRLGMIRKIGRVPGVGNAPYFIMVAERKGFPPLSTSR